jgi:hypothetical protein
MATDLTLNSVSYTITKIPSAIKQMQIARRVLPILSGGEKIEAIFNNIGSLKDEDFEYMLIGLLENVKRKDNSGVWSNIVVNGMLAYQDIDMLDLIQLAKASAVENFGFLGNAVNLMSDGTIQA